MRHPALVLTIGALMALPAPSGAAAAPARTGTILGGWAPGIAYLGASPRGCEWTAECAAWLASGCQPQLSGRDPGLHDSIVDVHGLGSRTRWWEFRITSAPLAPGQPTIIFGGLTVQLWNADCQPRPPS